MAMVMAMLMTVFIMFVVPMSTFVLPRIGGNHKGAQRNDDGKKSYTESF
jgi:hypothetical protein